jgi:hypothetical protein
MGPEEGLLDGVAQVAPGVPVVGGSSSDHAPEGKWRQFGNGHSYQGAFTIAALGGGTVGYAFANGYKLTGKKNDDGSIDTGVLLPEGQTLELGAGTPDELIAEVEKVVRDAAKGIAHPTAVLLAHCGGRAIALGDRIGEVAGKVQRAAPGLPWIGHLAFGEQGCALPGQASHATLSLSALVLGAG